MSDVGQLLLLIPTIFYENVHGFLDKDYLTIFVFLSFVIVPGLIFSFFIIKKHEKSSISVWAISKVLLKRLAIAEAAVFALFFILGMGFWTLALLPYLVFFYVLFSLFSLLPLWIFRTISKR